MDAMESDHPTASWGFWFVWVLATTFSTLVGVFFGLIVVGAIALAVRPIPLSPALGTVILYAIYSTFVGAGQWLVLRGHLRRAGLWVPASILTGLLFGLTVAFVFPVKGETWRVIVARGLVGGGVLGLPQWLILRFDARDAGWWLVVRTAYSIAAELAVEVSRLAVPVPIPIFVLTLTIEAFVGAMLSGLLLVWLLGHPSGPRSSIPVLAT